MRILQLSALLVSVLSLSCLIGLAGLSGWVLLTTPSPARIAEHVTWSVQVNDRDDQLLRMFTTSDGMWRVQAHVDRIDPTFLSQLLACEDKRFYSHPGVDYRAIIRAGLQYISHGRIISGASTITMQTVRLLAPHPRSVLYKIVEMIQALRLEQEFSKEEILQCYLSLAPYGGNIQGVEAASLLYFGHAPQRLTSSEAALLIALPQSPEQRRPDRHALQAKRARDRVLTRLRENNHQLRAEDALLAQEQAVPVSRHPLPFLAPHLADLLVARNKDKDTIRSTLDKELQRKVETVVEQMQKGLAPGSTMAVMVVENQSREVRAICGSGSYFHATQINMTRAVRSPGSALKPFIYGLGFEQGILHPETKIHDAPQRFGLYGPKNFDDNFHGWLTVREALQRSLNVPAVQVLQKIGAGALATRLQQVGVPLRSHGAPGLALALGGVGCSLEELIGLYTAVANGGIFAPLKYTQSSIKKKSTKASGQALLSSKAAWYLDRILLGNPFPQGIRSANPHIRYKTGTSYGFRDAWALGYDRRYTLGVWVGRPDGGSAGSGREASGSRLAVPVMIRLFAALGRYKQEESHLIPAGAITTMPLPLGLQWLHSGGETDLAGANTGPQIVYPLDETTVMAQYNAYGQRAIALKAFGGEPPLHWLINNVPLPAPLNRQVTHFIPDGPGQVQVLLIDAQGHQDTITLWVELTSP